MELNKEIVKILQQIQWFSQCGQQDIGDESIIYVDSWTKASKHYHSSNWEKTTLNASNELTAYLHKHFLREYSGWNSLVKEAKIIMQEILNEPLENTKNEFQLDQTFIDCVKWDVLGIIMEYTYLNKLRMKYAPFYSAQILNVYSSGHFPCGWEGKWPSGKLVVF
jgi:hypothetical protein